MAHGSLHQFKAFLERKNARKDKNRGKFEKNTDDYKYSNSRIEYNFPELHESELEKVKADIKSKIEREKRKQLLVFITIVILLFAIYLYYA